ncbi:tRNA 2-thiocytidine biosynthesis TtcA family protein [Clostridiaceae bacterium M8S5]|nr:tRNA 2-thiocytidine biosynthesis TtcA family protein [Clostridiaceae bacterium M8S5]
MKKVLGAIRKAVQDYEMIKDGDNVAVGVSGGKDSMVLLYGLKLFQHFSPVKYNLKAFSVTLGFNDFDLTAVKDFCKKIDVDFEIKETEIGKIVFDVRKEKNPCSLCAKMRRGALNDLISESNYNILALGHHLDDAIETLFLNMFYTGRISTFLPKTYLSRKNIHVIRPMIYLPEYEVKKALVRHNIPVVESVCPADKNTKREEIKDLFSHMNKLIPDARDKILTSLQNKEQFKLWF